MASVWLVACTCNCLAQHTHTHTRTHARTHAHTHNYALGMDPFCISFLLALLGKNDQVQEEADELRGALAAAKKESAAAAARVREEEERCAELQQRMAEKDAAARELRKTCSQHEVDIEEVSGRLHTDRQTDTHTHTHHRT